MNKKFEFTGEVKVFFGRTLHRIRAKIAFGNVEAGDIGGWIEKEENLAESGNAWVYGDAQVYGNARVYGDALVYGNARVYGNAWVFGNAQVYGDARVYGDAQVYGDARVFIQSHWLCIGPIGSRDDFTTFFRTKSLEIYVKCGCFRGSIQAFTKKVSETHGDSQYAKQYMAAIEVAKACINLTPEESAEPESEE